MSRIAWKMSSDMGSPPFFSRNMIGFSVEAVDYFSHDHICLYTRGRVLESIIRFVLRYVVGRFLGWS